MKKGLLVGGVVGVILACTLFFVQLGFVSAEISFGNGSLSSDFGGGVILCPTTCGNGVINSGEQCELPSTNNNVYCNQTLFECVGHKVGFRNDNKGNCNHDCGCVKDTLKDIMCVKGNCGAECVNNNDCRVSCENLSGCIGNDYYNYYDAGATCKSNCLCEIKNCSSLRIFYNDQRCTHCIDNDHDGYNVTSAPTIIVMAAMLSPLPNCGPNDCNDSNFNVHLNAPEKCNYIDDDCDGLIDESFDLNKSCFAGLGECRREGHTICSVDGLSAVCSVTPGNSSIEICDNKDNDCDGLIDEGFDQDGDGVADCFDHCPNSTSTEPVDQEGCDPFQFCSQFSCGFDCLYADWKLNEQQEIFPHDCVSAIVEREGTLVPECFPTEFSRECAN
ncbi:MAG: putative metal-binding motif-containing protein [Candidatus Pacearchaeota archaeon]|jgi:hypothetical protein